MNISKCKAGVVVQLKSGGPKMTCTGKQSEPDAFADEDERKSIKVQCQWFGGRKLESGWFPPESLIVPEESEGEKK